MPSDSRRLPVPDDSQNPHVFTAESAPQKLLNKDGKRQDGRDLHEFRPIFIRAGVVSQAKGSAYVELNRTKVICAVYGPRESGRHDDATLHGQVCCEVKFATFSSRYRRSHQQDSSEKDCSLLLQQALEPAVRLEKFPKARMDVFVTVLEDDGSAVAAAISCSSVALADAAVEMYDLVVGCTLHRYGNIMLLDPSGEEETNDKSADGSDVSNGTMTVGYMPSLHQVAALTQKGSMEFESVTEGLTVCIQACDTVYPVLQRCLQTAIKARLKDQPL